MITYSIFNAFFLTFLFLCFDSTYNFCCKFRQCLFKLFRNTFLKIGCRIRYKCIKLVIDFFFSLTSFNQIWESFIALLFNLTFFNSKITDCLCDNFLCFLFKMFLNILSVLWFYIRTVLLRCYFHNRRNKLSFERFLQLVYHFLFRSIFNYLSSLSFYNICYLTVYLISEYVLCLTDYKCFINLNFTLIVNRYLWSFFLWYTCGTAFGNRLKVLNNINNFLRSTENITDILKQEIWHKSTSYNFNRTDFSRNGKNLFGIEFNHFTAFIFTDDREEVKKFTNILFSRITVTFSTWCSWRQVICKFFKNNQSSCRIKIKYIGIFFYKIFATFLIFPRILCSERSLHI